MSILAFIGLVALAIALAAVVAVVVRLVRARSSRAAGASLREPTILAVQGGLAGGLLAAVVTAVVALSIDGAHPGWLGLPLALAPGLAASAGLLVVALTPALRAAPTTTRSAGLERRGAWTVGSPQAYLRPALAAVALAGVLLATGLTASLDETGLSRALSVRTPTGGSSASPYPGWFYAAPLLAVSVLLLLTALLAMRRIATLPALQSADGPADAAWRRAATSAVSLLATAGLLAYLAGVVLVTGSATRSVGTGTGTGLGLVAGILAVVALLLGVLACVAAGLAVARAVTFGTLLRAPASLPG